MSILNYKKSEIHKGEEYIDYAWLYYDVSDSHIGSSSLSFCVRYIPETKEVKIEKDDVFGSFEEQYHDNEMFNQLLTKYMKENEQHFQKLHSFYDKVYKFLKEETIELVATDMEDINGDKVRYCLKSFSPGHQLKINLSLKPDGSTINHFSMEENKLWISFWKPEQYPAIKAAKDKLITESDFRLKLLFNESI